eukprot:GEMP01019039.1.p1 GENE.GEMP01019039.1~~GEMP01019039.1.p1  ORF type:complete len:492 (+),score=101.19 GEMP01019039.1:187-1662(+)
MPSTFTRAEESTILTWVTNAIRHGLDIKSDKKKRILRFIAGDVDLRNLELSDLSDGKLLCAVVLAIDPTLIRKPCPAALRCISEFQKAAATLRIEDFELLSPPDLSRAEESCCSEEDKQINVASVPKSRSALQPKEIRGILDYSDSISFSERVRGFNVQGSPAIFPDADPELALKKPLIARHTAAFKPYYSKAAPHLTARSSEVDDGSCSSGLSPIYGDDAGSSDDSPLGSCPRGNKGTRLGIDGAAGCKGMEIRKHQLIDSESDAESDGGVVLGDEALKSCCELRVTRRKPTPNAPRARDMLPFGDDGEVCNEDGACSFGFDGRGFRSSMITRIEREVNMMSISELPSIKGYLHKKSPSKRQLYRYQRRYCVLKNLHLAWWESERDMVKKQEAKGSVSFVFHECVVVVDTDDDAKFALAPRDGRWENPSSFTGGGKRVFAFDCSEKGGRTRDAWLEVLSLHILAARKVRLQVGNLAHLSSPKHVQFDTMT